MAKRIIKRVAQLGGVDIRRYNKELDDYRALFFKYREFTMIPEQLFVANLELCQRFLRVEGDIVECGVWRGGMIAAMGEMARGKKRVHLFDSFEGLPPALEIDGKEALDWQKNTSSADYLNNCTADESFAIKALRESGSSNYRLYKGWFDNTLDQYEGNKISILRLDGDWYDSIKVCLNKLFPFVVEGGGVIIDDYYTWDGCSKAVHDYLSEIKSPSRVHQLNNQVAYIIKKVE